MLMSLGLFRMAAALPSPSGLVTDEAGVLDSTTHRQLESALVDFEKRTSIELAVVTLNSLDGDDVANVAHNLFQTWGIGKKGQDNGVLFLIAPNERRMRIEIGYGLEGQLTDAGAGRILDEAVVPFFKAGNMSAGIVSGASAIAEKLSGSPLNLQGGVPQVPENQPNAPTRLQKIIALAFFFFLFMILLRHPWLLLFLFSNRGGGGGWSGGGFGGGGFGGFGGGSSGGGGASRGW